MIEREELLTLGSQASYDWDHSYPHKESFLEYLADRILAAGFRKALELGELPTFVTSIVFDDGGVDDQAEVVRLFDLRRLAAPKEREWIPVTDGLPTGKFLVPCGDSVEVCDSARGFVTLANNPHLADEGWDGTFVDGRADWGGRIVRFSVYQPLPPPPTTPAQREGS